MIKQKYVLVDTQIWIYCCLSSGQGEDGKILKTLKDKLDNEEFKLILPETVQIEYARRVEQDLENFRAVFEKAEKEPDLLSQFPSHQKTLKKHIKQIKQEVLENSQKAKDSIDEIFQHKNTVKTSITPEILVNAQKRSMKGLKPYYHKNTEGYVLISPGLQHDCILLEEVIALLRDQQDYKIYVCTNNTRDFAAKEDGTKLHPDVVREFESSILYTSLSKLLNKEFKSDIKEDVFPKQMETENGLDHYSSAIQALASLPSVSSSIFGLDAIGKSLATISNIQLATQAMVNTVKSLQSITATNATSEIKTAIESATNAYEKLQFLYPQYQCSQCGETFYGTPMVGFLCARCFMKRWGGGE